MSAGVLDILDEFDDGAPNREGRAYFTPQRNLRRRGCAGVTKHGKPCKKAALVIVDDRVYCNNHAPRNIT